MRSFWLILALLAATPALAAPSSEPWPRWERQQQSSTAQVDQAPWAGILRRYLRPGADGINRFAYAAVSPADRAALEADVARLAGVPVSGLARPEQRAFWTNLYNELTVLVVLRAMPVSSITDIGISPGLFSRGPWDAKLVQVEGEPLSLNDIEHRILRSIWHDPRTHYAVNCASLGCPNLAPEPYSAAGMEAQLDRAARAYVNHPRGFQVRNGRLTVSSIYIWYKADFGGTDAGVIAHLRRYAEPAKAATLDGITRIGGDAYDWSLNGANR
ncbi:DUF547 domain-containing protein [Roseomonas haemaphysalidis]|uniref:DUF547 domain-containing protein n=1 Tax=Roseomonas haemaphysalidis TaxID=2768162 RepID=A0ABS3KLJ3_9PROT|nr:DUF547 domain-containing protein [Roseomonas haemaphysalidis]MBO1078326.1 DUF547 domain-containing protein [Roseomonas haemaphysalidis]